MQAQHADLWQVPADKAVEHKTTRASSRTLERIAADDRRHDRLQRYHAFMDTLSEDDGVDQSADSRLLGLLIGSVSDEAFEQSLAKLRQLMARHVTA